MSWSDEDMGFECDFAQPRQYDEETLRILERESKAVSAFASWTDRKSYGELVSKCEIIVKERNDSYR